MQIHLVGDSQRFSFSHHRCQQRLSKKNRYDLVLQINIPNRKMNMAALVQPLGRLMLALIFVLAGVEKVTDLAGTSAYMEAVGVPSALLWPTILLEVLGGIAIAIGYKTALAALGLALFSIAAAVLFHSDFSDKMQMILFLKNIAMTGGLLILATSGATAYSLDRKKQQQHFF
jgi:putative oxidoreductase